MELLSLLLLLLAVTLASLRPHVWQRDNDIREIALNMAPNSFDDQYHHCHLRMLKALPALNRSEFGRSRDYTVAWGKAAAMWGQRPQCSPLRLEQAIALVAYSMEEGLYLQLNRAVRVGGRSRQHYLHHFHFKVMHFLLTEALRQLQAARRHPRCLHVFRGVNGIRFTTRPGRIVRFGQFASTSLLRNVSDFYGTTTTFEVDTCYGASIRHYSNYPDEEEVLIPPFETFNVTSVTQNGDNVHISLRSHGMYSKYNCAWLRGSSIPRAPPGLTGLLLAALAAAMAPSEPGDV